MKKKEVAKAFKERGYEVELDADDEVKKLIDGKFVKFKWIRIFDTNGESAFVTGADMATLLFNLVDEAREEEKKAFIKKVKNATK